MSDTPRYMCVVPGCPGEHASKYLCCDFPEHQPGKWVGPLTVNTRGINIGICDAKNYRIAWSHFPEYAEALANICNSFDALTEANKTARINLAALIARPELRTHPSDIPATLNESDRQCIADAFNALKVSK
jgi:hypothetical protein